MNEEQDREGLHSIERSNMRRSRRNNGDSQNGPQRRSPEAVARMRHRRSTHRKRVFYRIVIVLLLIASLILLLISTTFSNASLTVTLRSSDISIDGTFSASREPSRSGDISYSVRGPFVESAEKSLKPLREEPQFTKAEGTVTVYNTNTSGISLDLVNRTRFQTEDGRIYRLKGAQNIPGGKTISGEFNPGSKVLTIEADEVGGGYNIEEAGVRFSIPGLAKYETFSESYALSKTDIVGGFSGKKFIADDEEVLSTRDELREGIREKLLKELEGSLEEESLTNKFTFENGIFITYESLEDEQREGLIVIKEEGTLRSLVFSEEPFSGLLTKYSSNAPSGVLAKSINIEDLDITVEERDDFDIVSDVDLSFRVFGEAKLFWDVDEVLFSRDISGKSRPEVIDFIREEYPQIDTVDQIKIFPGWRSTVPQSSKKISLDKKYIEG